MTEGKKLVNFIFELDFVLANEKKNEVYDRVKTFSSVKERIICLEKLTILYDAATKQADKYADKIDVLELKKASGDCTQQEYEDLLRFYLKLYKGFIVSLNRLVEEAFVANSSTEKGSSLIEDFKAKLLGADKTGKGKKKKPEEAGE